MTGGNDLIIAAPDVAGSAAHRLGHPSAMLIGDAQSVAGTEFTLNGHLYAAAATLHGGNDTLLLTNQAGYDLVGDVYAVDHLGVVIGGNDFIQSDGVLTNFGLPPMRALVGDVWQNHGYTAGGSDTIIASDYAFLTEYVAGDTFLQADGTTIGGADNIDGRGGHDYIAGDAFLAEQNLTGGADTIHGGEDADIIAGDAMQIGNDGPFGGIGAGTFVEIQFSGGNDHIFGDEGRDVIAGDVYAVEALAGGSVLHGGNDVIEGGDGNDALYGDFGPGPTAALISGHSERTGGSDVLLGGNGNDLLMGQLGRDTLNGGAGIDMADYSDKSQAVHVTLHGSTAATVFVNGIAEDTVRNVENLTGGYGNDRLTGDGLSNRLTGGLGNDTLNGAAGIDFLDGQAGNDSFVFNTAIAAGNVDRILHFSTLDDTIMLGHATFAGLPSGALAAGAFYSHLGAHAAHDANDRIVYDTATGKLFFDADGAGGTAAKLFAIVVDHPHVLRATSWWRKPLRQMKNAPPLPLGGGRRFSQACEPRWRWWRVAASWLIPTLPHRNIGVYVVDTVRDRPPEFIDSEIVDAHLSASPLVAIRDGIRYQFDYSRPNNKSLGWTDNLAD